MARARLHLICGNCGCNDEWKWEYIPEYLVKGELMQAEDVYLKCENCSTLHSINDNAKLDT
jgi:uncharacterized Zn finger protein